MKTTTAQFVATVKRVNKLLKSALISDVNDKRGQIIPKQASIIIATTAVSNPINRCRSLCEL